MTRGAGPSSERGMTGGQEMEQGPGTISPSPIIKGEEEGGTVSLPSSLVPFLLSHLHHSCPFTSHLNSTVYPPCRKGIRIGRLQISVG